MAPLKVSSDPSKSRGAHRQIKMHPITENATLTCGRRPRGDAVDDENRVTVVDHAAGNLNAN